ncbi:MAG: oligosaccharide flippase family protein, partial [Solirubrobacteraceae bacterium]
MISAVPGPDADGAPASGFGGVIARLAGLNALVVVVAMITGPLLARVLGPTGRGELSAIITVLVLAPLVLDFGLGDFITRER